MLEVLKSMRKFENIHRSFGTGRKYFAIEREK